MSSNQSSKSRAGRASIALVALAATSGALADPAGAASGQGTAAIILAQHDKGRTLSGQGVKVLAAAPASKSNRTLTVPISGVDPTANASATGEGALSFKRGKQSIGLTGLRFNLTAGTLSGNLGGEEIAVFKLGAAATVNASTGNVALGDGKLRLTLEAASALKEELGLSRALRHDGVGMAWLAAKANPTLEPAKAVVSGSADWGVLFSWRKYVLGNFGPGSVGAIAADGGATASGTLSEASGFLGFPAAGGSYQKGLYGAADKLVLETQGSVTFAKPGHCIIEVKLADLELTIDGASSSIVLDSVYDVDKAEGKTCAVDLPPVSTTDVPFASLDLSGVTPTYSADGRTVTWSAIPTSLTAAGSTAFLGGKYPAGQPLDPVTITAVIG